MGTILGSRVLLSRRDLDMKQGDLARRAGISRPYISRIETGEIEHINTDVLLKLASALGVSVNYLLGLTDIPLDSEQDAAPLATDDDTLIYRFNDKALRRLVQDLVSMIIDMTPSQRHFFYEMAHKLRDLDVPRVIE